MMYSKKLASACLGLLFFPCSFFLNFLLKILLLSVLIIALPVFSYVLVKRNYKYNPLITLFLSLLVAFPLLLLTLSFLSLNELIIFPLKLFILPFQGIHSGWYEGFKGIFTKSWELLTANSLLPQLGQFLKSKKMTPDEFTQLELQSSENDFITHPQFLTEDEELKLEAIYDVQIQEALRCYRNLDFSNMEPTFSFHSFNSDLIVLLKQYQDEGGEWRAVPNASYVTNKEKLRSAFIDHVSKHPINNELIMAPPSYEQRPCRYVIHPYQNHENKLISQERNEIVIFLKKQLSLFLVSDLIKYKRPKEIQEVKHFSSPLITSLSDDSDDNSSDDDLMYHML